MIDVAHQATVLRKPPQSLHGAGGREVDTSLFALRPNEASNSVGARIRQHAPKMNEVERFTFVCSQPPTAGPTLKPMLHVME